MVHLVVSSHTGLWRQETNMPFESKMTCKIGLMWRPMKTLYAWQIEGMHDMVRTYASTILQHLLASSYTDTDHYGEKNHNFRFI